MSIAPRSRQLLFSELVSTLKPAGERTPKAALLAGQSLQMALYDKLEIDPAQTGAISAYLQANQVSVGRLLGDAPDDAISSLQRELAAKETQRSAAAGELEQARVQLREARDELALARRRAEEAASQIQASQAADAEEKAAQARAQEAAAAAEAARAKADREAQRRAQLQREQAEADAAAAAAREASARADAAAASRASAAAAAAAGRTAGDAVKDVDDAAGLLLGAEDAAWVTQMGTLVTGKLQGALTAQSIWSIDRAIGQVFPFKSWAPMTTALEGVAKYAFERYKQANSAKPRSDANARATHYKRLVVAWYDLYIIAKKASSADRADSASPVFDDILRLVVYFDYVVFRTPGNLSNIKAQNEAAFTISGIDKNAGFLTYQRFGKEQGAVETQAWWQDSEAAEAVQNELGITGDDFLTTAKLGGGRSTFTDAYFNGGPVAELTA